MLTKGESAVRVEYIETPRGYIHLSAFEKTFKFFSRRPELDKFPKLLGLNLEAEYKEACKPVRIRVQSVLDFMDRKASANEILDRLSQDKNLRPCSLGTLIMLSEARFENGCLNILPKAQIQALILPDLGQSFVPWVDLSKPYNGKVVYNYDLQRDTLLELEDSILFEDPV